MLEKVKTALRISHSKLDSEITDLITTAHAEIARAGVVLSMIVDTNPLIESLIKTFVKMEFTTDMDKRESYEKSFKYQLDNLRKSGGYFV